MSVLIVRGDARHLPLPDASVDLICTSPPFWQLRSYTDGGEHYAGQLGSEPTPQEYIAALLDCTRDWIRALKPEGSLFVELGDTYSAYNNNRGGSRSLSAPADAGRGQATGPGLPVGTRAKSLIGLPWRYALGCMDELGLILRAEIIWDHKNGLPESVTDRARRAHSTVFHFTKQQRYYSAVDEIRVPHQPQSIARSRRNRFAADFSQAGVGSPNTLDPAGSCNPLGGLPGSVWEIASQPLIVPAHLGIKHHAAFPVELPRRIILGWSPPGICTVCGEGRRPVSLAEYDRQGRTTNGPQSVARRYESPGRDVRALRTTTITGYACACTPHTDHPGTGERYGGIVHSGGAQGPNKGSVAYHIGDHADGGPAARTGPWREYHLDGWTPPPTRPAVVVDPFSGAGTTILTASMFGRIGVGTEMSMDYCRLARWRTTDPGERAKALGVPKPPPVPDGQEPLFTL